jgi:UDP-MurNAc hydroxylase
VPNFKDKFLIRELEKIGADVLEIEEKTTLKVDSNFSVRIFISDVGVNHDSAVLINVEGETFFNQNDCKIFDRLNEIDQQIDIYSAQFSGANAYPSCFNYSKKIKSEISNEKSLSKLSNVLSALEEIKPRVFLPAAGPAIFPHLDVELSLGRNNIFIHQDELDLHLQKHGFTEVCYLRPGQIFDHSLVGNDPIFPPTSDDVRQLAELLPNVWDSIDDKFGVEKLVEACEARLAEIRGLKYAKCPILQFVWGEAPNDGITINLNDLTVQHGISDEKSYIRLMAEPKYFALMSKECVRWQELSLSMRATVRRKPDIFSNFANVFLFSDVSNIRSSFEASIGRSAERVIVEDNLGNKFEIDQFCPHQSAELSCAKIDDHGFLVCPRHGWKFNLSGGGESLKTGTSINSISTK